MHRTQRHARLYSLEAPESVAIVQNCPRRCAFAFKLCGLNVHTVIEHDTSRNCSPNTVFIINRLSFIKKRSKYAYESQKNTATLRKTYMEKYVIHNRLFNG